MWVCLQVTGHADKPGDTGCPGKFQTSLTCSLPKTEGGEKKSHQSREAVARQLEGGAGAAFALAGQVLGTLYFLAISTK